MTIKELFLKLANPNQKGVSRWVNTSEFVGKYKRLQFGNGGSWIRQSSSLAKQYIIETNKSITAGNKIDAVRLNGINKNLQFNQSVRKDIRAAFSRANCVMLGIRGNSENTKIEIDHKDGRKNNSRVSNKATQKITDFQALSKAANDAKRQICKKCIETNIRWDAKNLAGNPYSFYKGDAEYSDKLGCKGCYQYDPVEYRKTIVKLITKEVTKNTVDFIMKKLYSTNSNKNIK